MVKIPARKVDEELTRQQEEFDEPDESVYGKDVEEDLKRVIGNEPDDEGDGFLIAEEIEKDEAQIATDKPEDQEESEFESELEKIEKKEKHKEYSLDE